MRMRQKEYAQASTVLEEGNSLLSKGAAYAVVKQGEYGATLLGRDVGRNLRMFRCPAYPLKTLVDPTGAGDTFLGALAGYLSTLPPGLPPFEEVKKGCVWNGGGLLHLRVLSADALLSMTKRPFAAVLKSTRRCAACLISGSFPQVTVKTGSDLLKRRKYRP